VQELHGGEAVVAKGAQLDGIYVVEEGEMAVSDAEVRATRHMRGDARRVDRRS
jgi:CRP-like cAMP-binding protein